MPETHLPESGEADRKDEQPLRVEGLLQYGVQMFAQFAWQKMGFVANPATGKIDQDLAQARVAIDVLTHLAEHLEPMLDDRERRDLRNLLTSLRVSFARKSAGG
jgi:hypothetical protein